jgi:hypothetical protein
MKEAAGFYSGGCQCGAVRYRIEGTLADAHICHCRMCQKAAGNYFMPLARARKADVQVTRGKLAWFFSSDIVRRGFCALCGTPLIFDIVEGDALNIVLGSLDHPAAVPPTAQTGLHSRMPWFSKLTDLPTERSDSTAWYAAVAPSIHQHPDHDTQNWPVTEMRP